MLAKIKLAEIYNNVIVVISILTTITCYFIRDFDNVIIAKACDKNVFTTRDAMIIRLFYDENIIIARSFCGGNNILLSYNDVISISYSHIKFITLFRYLTLYQILNFEL